MAPADEYVVADFTTVALPVEDEPKRPYKHKSWGCRTNERKVNNPKKHPEWMRK
jgi:hypothetical protein